MSHTFHIIPKEKMSEYSKTNNSFECKIDTYSTYMYVHNEHERCRSLNLRFIQEKSPLSYNIRVVVSLSPNNDLIVFICLEFMSLMLFFSPSV